MKVGSLVEWNGAEITGNADPLKKGEVYTILDMQSGYSLRKRFKNATPYFMYCNLDINTTCWYATHVLNELMPPEDVNIEELLNAYQPV